VGTHARRTLNPHRAPSRSTGVDHGGIGRRHSREKAAAVVTPLGVGGSASSLSGAQMLDSSVGDTEINVDACLVSGFDGLIWVLRV
jgi:hypothetical protein